MLQLLSFSYMIFFTLLTHFKKDLDNYFKGLIFPFRPWENLMSLFTCAMLRGFGGFGILTFNLGVADYQKK